LLTQAPGVVDRDPNYGGDGLMVHDIRLTRGYHGNELGRYQRLASGERSGDYQNLLNPGFWRLSNTRYLYTNGAVNQPGLTPLLGPVRNSAGSTVYLYRLPGDNPPAWVAPAMVKAGDEATAGTILDPRFDPLRVAVIDSTAAVPTQPLSALPEPLRITPNITRYDPGHIAMELSGPAPAGSALVVSENYFPGWQATANGQSVPVVRADYNLIGVPLPAGATRISLDFTDAAFQRGKLVSLLALAVALAMIGAGALIERRRRVV
ncbi:MAG: YfhO family protein, partial [Gemmatimonadaceae bacterium]